jgi:predicted GNAT superfamily acetyltransferase
VKDRIAGRFTEPLLSEHPLLNTAIPLENGLLAPGDTVAYPDQPTCLVEIPPDIARLKSEAPDLALKWRLHTREIFEVAFATGYTAIDLLRHKGHNYYLLQKGWKDPPGV